MRRVIGTKKGDGAADLIGGGKLAAGLSLQHNLTDHSLAVHVVGFHLVRDLGFDRRHGEYTLVGFDTLGTYWVSGQGPRGEDGVIRMRGEDDDTMGGQVYTFEYEILGPDEHEYRVIFDRMGPTVYAEPFTMVSVRNTRKTD